MATRDKSVRLSHLALAVWMVVALAVLGPLVFGAGSALVIGDATQLPAPGRLARLGISSLKIAGYASVGAVLLGLPLALVFSRGLRPGGRPIFAACAMAPLFVPPGIMAVIAVHLFGANGFLTRMFLPGVETFSVPESLTGAATTLPGAPIFTFAGAGLTLAVCYFPIVFAAVAAALDRVDGDVELAARIDGGTLGAWRAAMIPTIGPTLVAAVVVVFLLALVEFSVPESLRSLPVLVGEVYVQFGVFFNTQGAFISGLALGVLSLGVAAPALTLIQRIIPSDSKDFALEHPQQNAWRELRVASLPGWLLAILPIGGIFGVLLYTMQGTEGRLATLLRTFSLAGEELRFGFGLSLLASMSCAFCGAILGAALARLARPRIWRGMLFLLFLLPGPLWGVGMSSLMRAPAEADAPEWFLQILDEITDSPFPLLIAWTLRFAPLAALLVERAVRRTPQDWRDAASLDGAGTFDRVRAYGWSTIAPSLAVAGLICFALTLGDPGAAVLLLPPGETTIAVRLMTLMHYAPQREVSALCLLGAFPPAALAGIAVWWVVRTRQRG